MPFPDPETALGTQIRAERALEVILEKKRAPEASYPNRTYIYISEILPQQLTAGFNNLHQASTTYERTEWRLMHRISPPPEPSPWRPLPHDSSAAPWFRAN